MHHNQRSRSIQYIAKVGVLSAMAAVLMWFEFPLAFIAPPFYKLDLSEVPILIGSFAMGPLAGVLMELLKNLLHLLIQGTSTNFVGELANFITGCAFVLPASILYGWKRDRKRALFGMLTGTLSLGAIGGFLNYFFLIPTYSALFGLPLDAIIGMGTSIHPAITDLSMLVVLAVLPFNLIKGVICSFLTYILYKHVSRFLRA